MWDRFLRACRREPVDATPVWFMRQAGRYMEEYRALRKKHTLIELCKNPELATEVTLQPVKALGVDAAILFADILLPLEPLGAPFEFAAGEGPVIHAPVRDKAGVDKLRLFAPEEGLGYVLAAIRLIRKELDGIPGALAGDEGGAGDGAGAQHADHWRTQPGCVRTGNHGFSGAGGHACNSATSDAAPDSPRNCATHDDS